MGDPKRKMVGINTPMVKMIITMARRNNREHYSFKQDVSMIKIKGGDKFNK